jgi:hypothetical protein
VTSPRGVPGGRPPGPAEPAVIAVDGGNSKTDLALIAADGTQLASLRAPGMPGRLSDENVQIIADLLRSAAGGDQPLSNIAQDTVACVANVDLPDDERQLERMLADQGWTQTTPVANDTFAVPRAGLDDVPAAGADRLWGSASPVAQGSTALEWRRMAGRKGSSHSARSPATGAAVAHSAWMPNGGRSGMRTGAVRRPCCAQLVPAHFGLAQPTDVAVALHLGKIGFDRLGELAPLVFDAADGGDQVARDIVRDGAN